MDDQTQPTVPTVTIQLPIGDQLCMDLLTTCVEGGSSYWLACDHVERDAELNVIKIVGCVDAEDDSEKWPDATLETIRTGIQRILEGNVKVRDDIRSAVLAAAVDPDSADWDAEHADCVLQAGLLNDIVYG
jgi:hypothetical protein